MQNGALDGARGIDEQRHELILNGCLQVLQRRIV